MSVEEKRSQRVVGHEFQESSDEENDFDQEGRHEADIRRVHMTNFSSSAHYLKYLNNANAHKSLVCDLQRHHWDLKKTLEKGEVAYRFKLD